MTIITSVNIHGCPGGVHIGIRKGQAVIGDVGVGCAPVILVSTPGAPSSQRIDLGDLLLVRGGQRGNILKQFFEIVHSYCKNAIRMFLHILTSSCISKSVSLLPSVAVEEAEQFTSGD